MYYFKKEKNGMPKILCILGKSAVGKDTLAAGLLNDKDLSVTKAISYTTRPRRENEVNGEDYYFISVDEFMKMRNNNEFLEETSYNVNGETWYYGFAKKSFMNLNKTIIAVINPRGLVEFINDEDIRKNLFVLYLKANENVRKKRYFTRDKALNDKILTDRWAARIKQDKTDFESIDGLLVRKKIPNVTLYTDYISIDRMVNYGKSFIE